MFSAKEVKTQQHRKEIFSGKYSLNQYEEQSSTSFHEIAEKNAAHWGGGGAVRRIKNPREVMKRLSGAGEGKRGGSKGNFKREGTAGGTIKKSWVSGLLRGNQRR